MATDRTSLTLPAHADYLELIGQYVSFIAARVGFGPSDVAQIRLAVDEACANVVLHVAGGADAVFTVVCEEDHQRLTVRVQDPGPPFDLAAVPKPDLDAPVERRKVGGLGIYLMRRVMDEVSLRECEGGKELVLVKRVPGVEGAQDGG